MLLWPHWLGKYKISLLIKLKARIINHFPQGLRISLHRSPQTLCLDKTAPVDSYPSSSPHRPTSTLFSLSDAASVSQKGNSRDWNWMRMNNFMSNQWGLRAPWKCKRETCSLLWASTLMCYLTAKAKKNKHLLQHMDAASHRIWQIIGYLKSVFSFPWSHPKVLITWKENDAIQLEA